jgi:hypothetical protein
MLDGLRQLFHLWVVSMLEVMMMGMNTVNLVMMRRRTMRIRAIVMTSRMKMMKKEMAVMISLEKREMLMVSPSPRGRDANNDHPSRASGLCHSSRRVLRSAPTFQTRSVHICCAYMCEKTSLHP